MEDAGVDGKQLHSALHPEASLNPNNETVGLWIQLDGHPLVMLNIPIIPSF